MWPSEHMCVSSYRCDSAHLQMTTLYCVVKGLDTLVWEGPMQMIVDGTQEKAGAVYVL